MEFKEHTKQQSIDWCLEYIKYLESNLDQYDHSPWQPAAKVDLEAIGQLKDVISHLHRSL